MSLQGLNIDKMKKALIIFVRKPELGKVKTRLAATIGDETALEVYVQLLKHTHLISGGVNADKFVFYADSIVDDDLWSSDNNKKKLQSGNNLGDKMSNAFSFLFDQGYKEVIIIGSDCPQLTTTLIEDAFIMLLKNEVVLGPAADGGYYLLGMKKLHLEIFSNIEWSTEKVLAQTHAIFESAGLSNILLPVLTDIDTEKDLKSMQHLNSPKTAP